MTDRVEAAAPIDVQVFPIPLAGASECVLVASLHLPQPQHEVAVVMVTGGRQTRAGSHRQYLRLARCFARNGYPCLRFDLPGQGDSFGEAADFDGNARSLRAAIDTVEQRAPWISRIVLWGLCDGATAATLYALSDGRVRALVLVNPWVRTVQGQSQVLMKSYYRQRLMSAAFWMKLLRGQVGMMRSVGEWSANWRKARNSPPAEQEDLPTRMFAALSAFTGAVHVVISERDLTGQEFMLTLAQRAVTAKWEICLVEGADHTLSQGAWHEQLEALSLDALRAAHH